MCWNRHNWSSCIIHLISPVKPSNKLWLMPNSQRPNWPWDYFLIGRRPKTSKRLTRAWIICRKFRRTSNSKGGGSEIDNLVTIVCPACTAQIKPLQQSSRVYTSNPQEEPDHESRHPPMCSLVPICTFASILSFVAMIIKAQGQGALIVSTVIMVGQEPSGHSAVSSMTSCSCKSSISNGSILSLILSVHWCAESTRSQIPQFQVDYLVWGRTWIIKVPYCHEILHCSCGVYHGY